MPDIDALAALNDASIDKALALRTQGWNGDHPLDLFAEAYDKIIALRQSLTALSDEIAVLKERAGRVLEWWPEGSEVSSIAARAKGDAFADDIRALRAALTDKAGS